MAERGGRKNCGESAPSPYMPSVRKIHLSGIFRIASNTRDFPDNIHVKTTNRLESLHYFNASTRRKITIARSHVDSHMVFEILNLHHVIAAYSPSNESKRTKFTFHFPTHVSQDAFEIRKSLKLN